MRKMIMYTTIDNNTFEANAVLRIKEDQDNKEFIELSVDDGDISKLFANGFTEKDIIRILQCNNTLSANNKKHLTTEEAKYMLDPSGGRWNETPSDPESLQKLAGFTVKKTITPYSRKSEHNKEN